MELGAGALTPGRLRTLHASGSSDVYITTMVQDGREIVVKRTKITCPGDMKRFDNELAFLLACITWEG